MARLDRLTRFLAPLGALLQQARTQGRELAALDVGIDRSTPKGNWRTGYGNPAPLLIRL